MFLVLVVSSRGKSVVDMSAHLVGLITSVA